MLQRVVRARSTPSSASAWRSASRSSFDRFASELQLIETQLRPVPRPDAGAAPGAAEVHGAVPAHAGLQAARRVREREQRARAVEQGGLGAGRRAAARAPQGVPAAPRDAREACRRRPASSRPRIGEIDAQDAAPAAVPGAHRRARRGAARARLAAPLATDAARRQASTCRCSTTRCRSRRWSSASALTRPRHARRMSDRREPPASTSPSTLDRVAAASTGATRCRGRTRATRTASGCRRSCCSRRRSRPCSPTTSASSQRFPTSRALAAAPLDDVLALWSGLGYYSRARNLHRCAQVVVAEHGGAFPEQRRRSSPSCPASAARPRAAIAAFCFGERVAILDGNVKRVLARVLAFDGDLAEATRRARAVGARRRGCCPTRDIEALHAGLDGPRRHRLPATRAALPALSGATRSAAARRAGRQERYPVKTRTPRARPRASNVWLVAALARRGLAGRARADTGVWAGLWSLPEFDSIAALRLRGTAAGRAAARRCRRFVHVLTHFDWHLQPGALDPARAHSARARRAAASARWPARALVHVSTRRSPLGLPAPLRQAARARDARRASACAVTSRSCAAQQRIDDLEPARAGSSSAISRCLASSGSGRISHQRLATQPASSRRCGSRKGRVPCAASVAIASARPLRRCRRGSSAGATTGSSSIGVVASAATGRPALTGVAPTVEARAAAAAHLQDAGLRAVDLDQLGERADVVEARRGSPRGARFAAAAQGDDAERRAARAGSARDQVEVARLEDLQLEQAVGEEHGAAAERAAARPACVGSGQSRRRARGGGPA